MREDGVVAGEVDEPVAEYAVGADPFYSVVNLHHTFDGGGLGWG